MSIPEFREELMKIFPCIYAIDGLDYLDYIDDKNVHHINYHHVLRFRFMNLVAGFDRDEILSRLSGLRRGSSRFTGFKTRSLRKSDPYQSNPTLTPLWQQRFVPFFD